MCGQHWREEPVRERTRRSSRSQVPDLPGLSCGSRDELCGQHWREEPVRDSGVRDPGPAQQASCSLQWGYGALLSQEGKTRVEEGSDAGRGDSAAEDIQKEGRTIHILRG